MSSPIQFVVGRSDLSDVYSDLSWSNVDPGGYEQLTATVSGDADIAEGQEVTVRCGLDVAWHGRVNELGAREGSGRSTRQIAALGYGTKLTDKRIQMIYADHDLSHWVPAAIQRRVNLAGTYPVGGDPSVGSDTTGNPSVVLNLTRIVNSLTVKTTTLALYRAPPGCSIGSIYYDITTWDFFAGTALAGLWTVQVTMGNSDISPQADFVTTPPAGAAGTLTATGAGRIAGELVMYYDDAFTADGNWSAFYRQLTVYGDHGLTKRGSDPKGFYPADIAGHALTHSGAGFELVADDSSALTVHHSVYGDSTPHEKVIADMALLMGWHYGVWEPASVLGITPRLFFTAPPPDPTCIVVRRDIEDLDSPKIRVDRLYDTANVKWTDPAGTLGLQTVTITNPLAVAAGVTGRTLDLDMGQGDSASATAFGTFALRLALASVRGGGSGTVPDVVTLPGGGYKPACLLKSGRDRIRIPDLPGSGSMTETDANRQDSFLVRRVETTVKNGQPHTRVEFDGGADLLEVLTARLALGAFG